MVVEACDHMVIRRAVENLPNLLQKALAVELRRGHKRIFLQQDVLAAESRVEAVMVIIERREISSWNAIRRS